MIFDGANLAAPAAEHTSQQQTQAEDHQSHQEENLKVNCWKQKTSEIKKKQIMRRQTFKPSEVQSHQVLLHCSQELK